MDTDPALVVSLASVAAKSVQGQAEADMVELATAYVQGAMAAATPLVAVGRTNANGGAQTGTRFSANTSGSATSTAVAVARIVENALSNSNTSDAARGVRIVAASSTDGMQLRRALRWLGAHPNVSSEAAATHAALLAWFGGNCSYALATEILNDVVALLKILVGSLKEADISMLQQKHPDLWAYDFRALSFDEMAGVNTVVLFDFTTALDLVQSGRAVHSMTTACPGTKTTMTTELGRCVGLDELAVLITNHAVLRRKNTAGAFGVRPRAVALPDHMAPRYVQYVRGQLNGAQNCEACPLALNIWFRFNAADSDAMLPEEELVLPAADACAMPASASGYVDAADADLAHLTAAFVPGPSPASASTGAVAVAAVRMWLEDNLVG